MSKQFEERWKDTDHVVIRSTEGELEVDLSDIPTEPFPDNEGFYLFIRGDVNDGDMIESFYHFPLIKKDLAMWLFYKLTELPDSWDKNVKNISSKKYETIQEFLPKSDYDQRSIHTVVNVCMLLYRNGQLSKVAYDKNYTLVKYKELLRQEFITNAYYCPDEKVINTIAYYNSIL